MGTHHFCDKRIKLAHQFTGGSFIMTERSRHQLARISRIHVGGFSSTILTKTGAVALRLQTLAARHKKIRNQHFASAVMSFERGARCASGKKNKGNNTMKRNLLALAAAAVIGFGGLGIALARGGSSGHYAGVEHLVKSLNLTPEQQAKIQPMLSQTRPQIEAIYEDAAAKTHTVMSNALAQVRPLLNPDQQKKFDAQQKAYEGLRIARKELHEAMRE